MAVKAPATLSAREAEISGLPLGPALFTMFLCILFGANTVAVKISLTGLGIFTTAGLRFAIATVVITSWAVCMGKPLALTWRQALLLSPLAGIFFLQLTLFNFGQSMTTASHGTLISNILPFVVMILAHYFIPGETIRWHKVGGLVLGFAGVMVLFFDTAEQSGAAIFGDSLIFLAVLIWAVNAVYVKKIIGLFSPLQITLYPMAVSVPFFLICGYLWDDGMIRSLEMPVLAALLYQALVTASFGFVAWNTMISRYGATALHSFVFVMPISGVLLGVTLLNEPVTAHLLLAIVLVTVGLVVVNGRGAASVHREPRILP